MTGIGDQCERVCEYPADELDEHEAGREPEGDAQQSAAVRQAVMMVVAMIMIMIVTVPMRVAAMRVGMHGRKHKTLPASSVLGAP
jgi:hypothetical protein